MSEVLRRSAWRRVALHRYSTHFLVEMSLSVATEARAPRHSAERTMRESKASSFQTEEIKPVQTNRLLCFLRGRDFSQPACASDDTKRILYFFRAPVFDEAAGEVGCAARRRIEQFGCIKTCGFHRTYSYFQ